MAIKAQKGYYTVKNPSKVVLPQTDPILKNRILKDKEGNILFEYRSKWEGKLMQVLEVDESVKMWGYENDTIKYLDPTTILPNGDFKERNYFIDFVIWRKEGFVEFVEVKPYCQTIAPIKPTPPAMPKNKTDKNGKITKKYESYVKKLDKYNKTYKKKYDTYLKALETYEKNMAKWKFARKKCENLSLSFGVDFRFEIYTEKDRLKGIV